MTLYRTRTIADLRDIGRDWRQQIIRAAGLDPDGRCVPMPPRPPPDAATDTAAAAERDATLLRALEWTWK